MKWDELRRNEDYWIMIVGGDWPWLKMFGNGWGWIKISDYYWRQWDEMIRHDLSLFEIVEDEY